MATEPSKEENVVEPVVEAVTEAKRVTAEELTTPKKGDSEAQAQLRTVYASYFKQNPEREVWWGNNQTLLDELNKRA